MHHDITIMLDADAPPLRMEWSNQCDPASWDPSPDSGVISRRLCELLIWREEMREQFGTRRQQLRVRNRYIATSPPPTEHRGYV